VSYKCVFVIVISHIHRLQCFCPASSVVLNLNYYVLQVISDDPSLLVVHESRRKSVSEANIVHYPLELQVAASVWKGAPPIINVEVKCPTTGQVYMVPVRIQRGDQSGN